MNLLRKYLPEVFYVCLAMDRLAWDTLQKGVDPDAAGVSSRMEERARKEQGTAYYCRPVLQSCEPPDLGQVIQ